MEAQEIALLDGAWRAVIARDARADGTFVFAVTSTRIYCRPSCPARRPRRERVHFFRTPEEAEGAGYRACRRCRPGSVDPSPAAACVEAARRYIDARGEERVTLGELARHTGSSPFHLQRTFKRLTGVTPRAYADARRARRLRSSLRSAGSVTSALYEAGFGSSSRLYERSDALLGMTPGAYRRGGRGLAIRFTTVAAARRRLLLAATDRGICALLLGGSDAELERNLRREFPNAAIRRVRRDLERQAREAVRRVEGAHGGREGVGAPGADPPLDLQATAFEWRVWQALRRIPCGQTRTYAEIAASIGRPRAARAVGGACSRNRVAVLVPCHRAVRADGGLGGYRWGLDLKQRLLERETATLRSARRARPGSGRSSWPGRGPGRRRRSGP
jgi:AraC family transcriptional regulator of adaptative response/methylated-DNA-[protein]-cysteine methyltransferase